MFTLSIPVSADRLDILKAELTHRIPNVKSSHRCEALARGLGFRTFASALAATRSGATVTVHVLGDPFTAYLSAHNFEISPNHLYHAAAKVALCEVASRVGALTAWGIGVGRPPRMGKSIREYFLALDDKFRAERAELTGDSSVPAFLASLCFLEKVPKTKTVRTKGGSYWIKHIAENFPCTYPNGESLGPVYVPNGVLIAAALHAGFNMKTHIDAYGYEEVNVSFNMSRQHLKDLDCEYRPTESLAESRCFREQMRRNRQRRYGASAL